MGVQGVKTFGHRRRLVLFALVGGSASLIYIVIFALVDSVTGASTLVANIVAYGIAIPFSYAGHKYLTFSSSNPIISEFPKYIMTQTIGFLSCTTVSMALIDGLHVNHIISSIASTSTVPLISYALSNIWVYR